MARKYYTDFERMEAVKKWKVSGLPVKTFADRNGLNRETFRTWVDAYHDIEGRFVRLNFDENKPNELIKSDEATMNILTDNEILKKSHHFSRFDHSIVVIEYKNLKITTSLEQAMAILDKIL